MKPYPLMSCTEVRVILNRRASGEQDLLEALEEIDADSVYYHTHSYYLRGKYTHGHYPNDFAAWVHEQVRDRVLSERLAMIDPFGMADLEALRLELIVLIEGHLRGLGFSPRALFGDPFEFLVARVVPIPTGTTVATHAELREAFRTAAPDVLYWHFFEDAFHRGRRHGTIVEWVAKDLGDEKLAAALRVINPYRLHIEQLRTDLIHACEEAGA